MTNEFWAALRARLVRPAIYGNTFDGVPPAIDENNLRGWLCDALDELAHQEAIIDLGDGGRLLNATVRGDVTVKAKHPDQVNGCCFIGKGIPWAGGIKLSAQPAGCEDGVKYEVVGENEVRVAVPVEPGHYGAGSIRATVNKPADEDGVDELDRTGPR